MTRLASKHAVITGGGSGIGEAIARRFAAEGAQVVIADFNRDAAERVAQELGGRAVACDVSKTDSIRDAFAALERIGILVNCAGIAHVGNVESTTPEDLDRLYGEIGRAHV